jgi:hypothetical protein
MREKLLIKREEAKQTKELLKEKQAEILKEKELLKNQLKPALKRQNGERLVGKVRRSGMILLSRYFSP